ncbi:MAG TPA: CoA pyrophosphatase [Bacillota bacterium]|nr:CoA pyrophosphatase [Bacillota bacterium]HPT88003.1 CoA pyrophosphatase [Bacillota bacterium]
MLDKLRENLPSSPGISGKDDYHNAAVMVLLIPVDDEYHIVFEKRNANIPQGDEICLPGGGVDPAQDVSPEQTAIRETAEELGISETVIQVIGRLDTVVALMGTTVDVVVGTAQLGLDAMRINREEVAKVFTLPVRFFAENPPEEYQVMVTLHPSYLDRNTGEEICLLPAAQLGLGERYHQAWGGYRSKVYVYRTEHGAIWGITARILNDLIKRWRSLVKEDL